MLLSIIAIIVAIVVPTTLAANQNKIALFEKRFELYQMLKTCLTFKELIMNSSHNANDEIIDCCISAFSNPEELVVFTKDKQNEQDNKWHRCLLCNSSMSYVMDTLEKGMYLCHFNPDIKECIEELRKAINLLISYAQGGSDYSEYWQEYMNACNKIKERNIIPEIEKMLQFNR